MNLPLATSTSDGAKASALAAWRKLYPAAPAETAVKVLKQRRSRGLAVLRLEEVGHGGTAIIAKRDAPSVLRHERLIYTEVLSSLSLPALCCHGEATGPDGATWLFLEDAGLRTVDPAITGHRRMAAHWLGVLHVSTQDHALLRIMPDRNHRWHLDMVRDTRAAVVAALARDFSHPLGSAVLRAVLARCDLLTAEWGRIVEPCRGFPSTLVHGDFKAGNLGLRKDLSGEAVLPFDWEMAGQATPTNDLHSVDLEAYSAAVRPAWRWATVRELDRLAQVGRIFRNVCAFNWQVLSLPYSSAEGRSVRNLAIYARRLDAALAALAIGSRDLPPLPEAVG